MDTEADEIVDVSNRMPKCVEMAYKFTILQHKMCWFLLLFNFWGIFRQNGVISSTRWGNIRFQNWQR